MKIPSRAEINAKIIELIEENAEAKEAVTADKPLINVLGLDSLDIIELGFGIQETFDFAFSDKNAIEELDKTLGGGRLLVEGTLTAEGRALVLERMPELKGQDLPEPLEIRQLQGYYTVDTFGRLVEEFYKALPATDPASGKPLTLEDFNVRTTDGDEVRLPDGDALVDAWVADAAKRYTDAV